MEVSAVGSSLQSSGSDLAQLVQQLHLIRINTLRSGDYATAAALADQILDLAEREGSAASLAVAHHGKLQAHYYRGDLAGTEARFALWTNFREAAAVEGHSDSGVVLLATAGTCAWLLGHIEIARERMAEAIALARDTKDPFALRVGGSFEALFYRLASEPERADAAAARAWAVCEEHGMSAFRNLLAVKGWARAKLGNASDGVSLIRQGLADLTESNFRSLATDALTCLAEAQALDGMTDDALITIEEALHVNSQEVLGRPEALRIRGELRQKVGQAEASETDFRDAIALAQKMKAKMLELRAATSLARLLRDTDHRNEARAMLAEIYSWFTEGFDTADLKDAKALLEELGA
jgi:tetratricopeptide (TPR) repeat protein